MEPVEVVSRIDIYGRHTPLSFTWQGQSIPVASAGRRWVDERGEHILVMIPFEQVCELVFNQAEGRWYVRFFSSGTNVA
jgi:hypothetical protein